MPELDFVNAPIDLHGLGAASETFVDDQIDARAELNVGVASKTDADAKYLANTNITLVKHEGAFESEFVRDVLGGSWYSKGGKIMVPLSASSAATPKQLGWQHWNAAQALLDWAADRYGYNINPTYPGIRQIPKKLASMVVPFVLQDIGDWHIGADPTDTPLADWSLAFSCLQFVPWAPIEGSTPGVRLVYHNTSGNRPFAYGTSWLPYSETPIFKDGTVTEWRSVGAFLNTAFGGVFAGATGAAVSRSYGSGQVPAGAPANHPSRIPWEFYRTPRMIFTEVIDEYHVRVRDMDGINRTTFFGSANGGPAVPDVLQANQFRSGDTIEACWGMNPTDGHETLAVTYPALVSFKPDATGVTVQGMAPQGSGIVELSTPMPRDLDLTKEYWNAYATGSAKTARYMASSDGGVRHIGCSSGAKVDETKFARSDSFRPKNLVVVPYDVNTIGGRAAFGANGAERPIMREVGAAGSFNEIVHFKRVVHGTVKGLYQYYSDNQTASHDTDGMFIDACSTGLVTLSDVEIDSPRGSVAQAESNSKLDFDNTCLLRLSNPDRLYQTAGTGAALRLLFQTLGAGSAIRFFGRLDVNGPFDAIWDGGSGYTEVDQLSRALGPVHLRSKDPNHCGQLLLTQIDTDDFTTNVPDPISGAQTLTHWTNRRWFTTGLAPRYGATDQQELQPGLVNYAEIFVSSFANMTTLQLSCVDNSGTAVGPTVPLLGASYNDVYGSATIDDLDDPGDTGTDAQRTLRSPGGAFHNKHAGDNFVWSTGGISGGVFSTVIQSVIDDNTAIIGEMLQRKLNNNTSGTTGDLVKIGSVIVPGQWCKLPLSAMAWWSGTTGQNVWNRYKVALEAARTGKGVLKAVWSAPMPGTAVIVRYRTWQQDVAVEGFPAGAGLPPTLTGVDRRGNTALGGVIDVLQRRGELIDASTDSGALGGWEIPGVLQPFPDYQALQSGSIANGTVYFAQMKALVNQPLKTLWFYLASLATGGTLDYCRMAFYTSADGGVTFTEQGSTTSSLTALNSTGLVSFPITGNPTPNPGTLCLLAFLAHWSSVPTTFPKLGGLGLTTSHATYGAIGSGFTGVQRFGTAGTGKTTLASTITAASDFASSANAFWFGGRPW